MPEAYTFFLGQGFNSYTLFIGLGVLSVALLGVMIAPRDKMSQALNWLILALILGLVLGRAGHVLLHSDYFLPDHAQEALRLNAGGLNWHGALLGVGIASLFAPRGIAWGAWAGLALPILGAFAWTACGAWGCAYGAEVATLADYPFWAVWERVDLYGLTAPRFATQPLGVGMSLGIIALLFVVRQLWQKPLDFAWVLIIFSVGMFVLGFLRGDSMRVYNGLRLDQWLDLSCAILTLSYNSLMRIRARLRK